MRCPCEVVLRDLDAEIARLADKCGFGGVGGWYGDGASDVPRGLF